jgi:polyhydroxyalkanoate synthase
VETNGGAASSSTPTLGEALGEPWRLWRRMMSLPRVFEAAFQTRAGVTPREVVMRQGTHELVRYARATPPTQAQPVLLCYALINRPYILDLEPGKSVVQQYLDRGFDVYMIDWGSPTDADRGLGLAHYVEFVERAVGAILRRTERPNLHLLGYCMGGTLSALFAALNPAALKTLALLAAPIDFSGSESLLNLWTAPGCFDVDAFIDTHGNCPAWFLQSCFLWMNPIKNFFDKPLAFYEHMDDPRSVTSTFALERWLNDNIPVAGETFREFVKKLYQQNQLVRGELAVGGRRVELGRITCPLLLLTARNDHLVAPEATERIRPYVGSPEVASMSSGAGHVGLVVGGKAHQKFWPEVTRWVAERSTPRTASRPIPARTGSSEQQPTT